MAVAELDAGEDLGVHEGLAKADQHHVFGGIAGLADERVENIIGHVRLGLLWVSRGHIGQ